MVTANNTSALAIFEDVQRLANRPNPRMTAAQAHNVCLSSVFKHMAPQHRGYETVSGKVPSVLLPAVPIELAAALKSPEVGRTPFEAKLFFNKSTDTG